MRFRDENGLSYGMNLKLGGNLYDCSNWNCTCRIWNRTDYEGKLTNGEGASAPFPFFSRLKHLPLWKDNIFRKGIITMLEMVVFALVLVLAQFVGGFIMMKYVMKAYMNKEFIKSYTKMGMEVAQEIAKEMEEDF
jgi:hypothetical protein